ncbi:hypothetical protein CVT26_010626 [Gymnopilus dilepis]|uniref:Uncharacterized protein n=1 Tax=Gymnopilus dilepis TaxID=231916 RepID=A0A409W589_9AGAR|nr:hypothetical protein CVT26_010626 [Gymnopilus dilepis]
MRQLHMPGLKDTTHHSLTPMNAPPLMPLQFATQMQSKLQQNDPRPQDDPDGMHWRRSSAAASGRTDAVASGMLAVVRTLVCWRGGLDIRAAMLELKLGLNGGFIRSERVVSKGHTNVKPGYDMGIS